MSEHAQLVFGLGVACIASAGAIAFACWVAWSLFWDLYDHLQQQRTRRRNTQFDARVGRDCYRDVRGLTR